MFFYAVTILLPKGYFVSVQPLTIEISGENQIGHVEWPNNL